MTHASNDTIAALSTPPGQGAIAVIRLSGPETFPVLDGLFRSRGKKALSGQPSHTVHYGRLQDGDDTVDEVVVAVFRAPHSYTGEDVAEISCHGSTYLQQRILGLLARNGIRLARPGEFTERAFVNGKMDLSQAEAVADLVAASSAAEHRLALEQLRGGYSEEMKQLREELIHFASLIELELDFSEEDVEFADRQQLQSRISAMAARLRELIASFETGNAIRQGIPVVIAGKPNAGKSTLLNAILKEERALVSDIPGTTRDTVEERIVIDGIPFRFVDTAGLRETEETVEQMGVRRTREKMASAAVILYVFDPSTENVAGLQEQVKSLQDAYPAASIFPVCNKADLYEEGALKQAYGKLDNLLVLSARTGLHLPAVHEALHRFIENLHIGFQGTIVTSSRHAAALQQTLEALEEMHRGLASGLTGDLLSLHLRSALHQLGSITGEIATDDLLKNIFSRFCIGK